MIMEYAEGGELFNYIIEKGNLSEKESRNIFQQIIDAIYYLHQIGICHRDLKPENILFDSKDKKRIKIIDFGLSNLYMVGNISNNNILSLSSQKDLLETPCGSPGYAPPEMILGCKYDGIMTDIWSSGIILYAMLCGCLPFDDFSEDKLYSKIIKGNYDYPPMIEISDEAKKFINSILVVNPKQRANIEEIKNNKWFSKNYKPSLGLYNSICEIPVSNLILKEMQKRGYDEEKIVKYIKNNNHNSLTTIYYLLVKQKSKQGIETESDMNSNIFQEFIKEQNLKNQKNNIKPISLKMFIKVKKNLDKNKENKNNKEEKETKKEKNKDKENINKNKDLENKELKDKNLNKRKNKTISKEKNQNINNIHINNIKNIHFININNIKTNVLKTCDSDNNRIKLYKKITELSKNRKDYSNSNSKKKRNNKLNTININKMKEGQFRNYMNLQNNKKNATNSRTKKIKKDKINRVKNNKTMLGDLNQINKDFNLSLNNNENKNNSIAIDKNAIKKGIFLSKNINNITYFNRDKSIMNYKKKFNTKKINGEMALKQLCFNKIKNNEIIKQKYNSRKKSNKENILINIKNHKIHNLKIESIPKMGYLLNDFKTSRIAKNKYIMNSVSNSQSKSKSRGTKTSNSSNTKSNSIKDRVKKENFFAFKSSRNNNRKSKSGNKIIDNKFTNLTQEKLSNLKSLKFNNNTLGKEKNNYIQSKNIINKRSSTNSKSKKKVLSKSKNKTNNYYYKLQNFKTSIEHHKLKKKIKPNNYMHILINDKNSNIIQINNTNIIENKKINEKNNDIYLEKKKNQSLNFGIVINSNKNKDSIKNNKIKNIKDESFNQNNIIQKIKKNEDIVKNNININNYIKQKNNLQKKNLNKLKKNINEKVYFHGINNYNKLKEYNKYSILNNISNMNDDLSQEFCYDISNLKTTSKNKICKVANNPKIIKSNNNKKYSKKKIKIGDLKPFQIKNFPLYQDIKPQTYRKDKKIFDDIISNDSKLKDNNTIYPLVNFSNNSIINALYKNK